MKKKLLLLAVLAMSILAFASCSSNGGNDKKAESNSDEIVLGMIGPLTGNLAEYGGKEKNGAELAIEEINANGGILGKQIKYVTYDTEGDATKAIDLFNRLIENDKMTALVGPVITSECNAVSEVAQEKKVPMFTPSGTGVEFTKGKDYAYRMCFTDDYQGTLMGKYAATELKVKTAAVVYNNTSDYSIGLANAFKARAEELGVQVVAFEAYGKDDSDFSALATKIKATNPEAIFLPDYYTTIANIIGQFKSAGIDAKMLGGDGWDGAQVEFSDAVEGGLFVSHYATKDTTPIAAKFTKAYQDKYGHLPNSFAALAYDTVYTYKKAIEDANSTDSAAIIAALQKVNIDTVCSDGVHFNKDGDPENKMAPIQIFKNGDVEFVTKVSGK